MTQYYTEEEKEIFIQHFLKKASNSKKNFEGVLSRLIKENGIEDLSVPLASNYNNIDPVLHQINRWSYDLSHILWDSNDNLATYILSSPTFSYSSSMIKDLNKLKVDWTHVNSKGENILHLSAKVLKTDFILEKLEVYPKLADQLNDDNKPFTYYLLSPEKLDRIFKPSAMTNNLLQAQSRFIICLKNICNLWSQYPEHFERLTLEDINTLKLNMKEIEDTGIKNLQLWCAKEKRDFKEVDKALQINVFYEHINTILANAFLEKSLTQSKSVTRRQKI